MRREEIVREEEQIIINSPIAVTLKLVINAVGNLALRGVFLEDYLELLL